MKPRRITLITLVVCLSMLVTLLPGGVMPSSAQGPQPPKLPSPPNRYFVMEWNNVKGGDPSNTVGGDDTFRFEVILYENGNFDFEYQAMTYGGGSWYCGTGAGIEDSRGLDGLTYLYSCNQAPSNKAVHFTRPAPTARVNVTPLYYGQFTHADQTVAFKVPIRNTGELGADTYDLFWSSAWPVSFYAADGTTPLADADGDFTLHLPRCSVTMLMEQRRFI